MEINELIGEAERCLREADPLCGDANAYYAELRLLVEQSTILWARILFLHSAQQDQLQSMGNICLVVKNGVDKARRECQHKIKAMRRSRAELRSLLASLRATPLDPAFVRASPRPPASPAVGGAEAAPAGSADSSRLIDAAPAAAGPSLHQFVHENDVAALDARVDDLSDQVLRRLAEIEPLPGEVQAKLSELRARSPDVQEGVMQELPRKMARMTAKSAPFASQMADLLVALTSHYDLCSQIPQLRGDDAAEATQVALGDRDQVLRAVEQLREARSQLKARHRESQRMQNSLDMTFEQCKACETELAAFIATTLRPALTAVQHCHAASRALFGDLDAVTNELASLTEYYRLFRKSYHALVVEISRRHESAKQLRKVVENANNALHGFQTREAEVRASFMHTYQEFLPPELWAGLADPPREYTITLEPEELPEISKATMLVALKEHK